MIETLPHRFFRALEEWNTSASASSRRIPLPEEAQERPTKPTLEEDDERPYVLIVEDDGDIRSTLRDLLEDVGYRVQDATDGIEALRILDGDYERYFAAYYRDEPLPPRPIPDVILLDIMMPEMDGLEFFAVMRTSRPQFRSAKIIAMSAGADIGRFQQWAVSIDGLENDIDSVSKPFEPDQLITKIAAACTAPRNGS